MRAAILLSVVGFVSASAGPCLADEVRDAKKALRVLGVRVVRKSLALEDETQLTKSLRETKKLKKALVRGEKDLAILNKQEKANEKILLNLKKQYIQFNSQLANINRGDAVLNNRIVGALNTVEGQIWILNERQKQHDEKTKGQRQSVSRAREAFIQHVLEMRTLADRIGEGYTTKAADKDIQAAITDLNAASDEKYILSPSRGFQSNLRRLKSLEDTVLSESIPLRARGNSLLVTVVVNSQHPLEMVLDSGANLVILPRDEALRFGLEPGTNDPTIRLHLADGSIIQGKLMKLAEVRVGKFKVKDVECAVLGPEAVAAEPLLGMSFLDSFKFEINAQAKTLTMVKVEASSNSSYRRPSRAIR